jgi:hypothetical protein
VYADKKLERGEPIVTQEIEYLSQVSVFGCVLCKIETERKKDIEREKNTDRERDAGLHWSVQIEREWLRSYELFKHWYYSS